MKGHEFGLNDLLLCIHVLPITDANQIQFETKQKKLTTDDDKSLYKSQPTLSTK